jgi:peptidoglycan/xylan/chitin deacetylase (PgdA/CDA1 family)
VLKHGASATDRVRRPAPGITILIYHRVGAGSGGQMDLSPSAFEDQVAWLARRRRVVDLDTAADELSAGGPPQPGVVVTFDDGTEDWLEVVLPILERHGVPATFYVATGFVEDRRPLPGGGRPISWPALRDLDSSDLVTVGSHTHDHLLLDRLPADRVEAELDRSIELLADHLGAPPRHFAYPKAVAGSPSAEAAVRERFRTAVLAGTRANQAGADLHRLWRSPIQPSDGERFFRAKADGGLGLEDDLRRAVNRFRHRSATT